MSCTANTITTRIICKNSALDQLSPLIQREAIVTPIFRRNIVNRYTSWRRGQLMADACLLVEAGCESGKGRSGRKFLCRQFDSVSDHQIYQK